MQEQVTALIEQKDQLKKELGSSQEQLQHWKEKYRYTVHSYTVWLVSKPLYPLHMYVPICYSGMKLFLIALQQVEGSVG